MTDNPGQKDRLITIQNPGHSVDGLGSVVSTPSTHAQVWAEVRHLKGAEFVEAQQQVAQTDTKFRVWWSSQVSGVKASWLVLFDGVTYEILGLIPLPGGRPEELEIFAKRRAD